MRRYPAYTHDDVFLLEYHFAMTLLRLIKTDADVNAARAKVRRQQEETESRSRKRKIKR